MVSVDFFSPPKCKNLLCAVNGLVESSLKFLPGEVLITGAQFCPRGPARRAGQSSWFASISKCVFSFNLLFVGGHVIERPFVFYKQTQDT